MGNSNEIQKAPYFTARWTYTQVVDRFRTVHPASGALYKLATILLLLGIITALIFVFTIVMPEVETVLGSGILSYTKTERVFSWAGFGAAIGVLMSSIATYIIINRFAISLDTAATTQAIIADMWASVHNEE